MAKHPNSLTELLKNLQSGPNAPAPIDPSTVQLPGLQQLGQQGLAEFDASAPLTPGNVNLVPSTLDPSFSPVAPTSPTEQGIGDRILGNLADSRFGQFLGKIETVDLSKSGQVVPGSGEAAFPALRERTGVEPFGSSNPAITGLPQAPTGPLSTPESIADLSFNGTPLTPDIFNQAPTAPQAAQTAPVAPQAPVAPPSSSIGGTITRDRTGETTFFRRGGGRFTPDQSEIDKFQAASDFAHEIDPATRHNAAISGSAPLTTTEQANVDAGRARNISAGDIQAAQREGLQREADEVQRAAQGRIEEGMKQFTRDNRNATVGEQQQQRALLVAQEAETAADQGGRDQFKAQAQRLEIERKQQIIDKGNQPNATGFQKKQGEWEERQQDLQAAGVGEKEIAARRRAFLHGDTFDPFEFENTGGDTGSTGGSTSEAGSTPAASTEAPAVITTQAEYDALAVGTKYVDENGKAGTKK